MTREEALNDWLPIIRQMVKGTEVYTEALDMAIKALEQEPCDDAVSRQAVLEQINCWIDSGEYKYTNATYYLTKRMQGLPSVTPQPQKWIPVSERLPEDSELVLFSTKTDRVFEGRYFDDDTKRQWYSFRDETFAWDNVVTAWMPLPLPYKQEVEE